MTETVPADIAAAIDDLLHAAHATGATNGAWAFKQREDARAALDAAILHHLRGYAEMKTALERIEQGV